MPQNARMPRTRTPPPSSRSDAAPLTKERIVETALGLLSEHGLDGFSIRDVARTLEVYPTAIYWYVPSKGALLGEICTLAMAKVMPPRGKGAWDDWLRELFRRYRRIMKRHPHLAQLVGAQLQSNSERNIELIERILAVLAEAGCAEGEMLPMYNVVIAAMSGFPTLEFAPEPSANVDEWHAAMDEKVASISAERHPHASRHLPALAAGHAFILRRQSGHARPMDASFEAWLDVVMLGIRARIDGHRSA